MRSKSLAVTPPETTRLEVVHRRFERWRRMRSQRCRVPDALWRAAAEVAGEIGVSRTARILRLDYYTLKRHLEGSRETGPAPEAAQFVELTGPTAHGWAECCFELEHPGGARMRMEIKGAALPDLVALSRSFWGSRP
jgi:hypothetical protein